MAASENAENFSPKEDFTIRDRSSRISRCNERKWCWRYHRSKLDSLDEKGNRATAFNK